VTDLHLHWSNPAVARDFRTGISLHSHTSLSKETLLFVPRHTQDVPVLSPGIRKLEASYRRHHGHDIDYSQVWWTPPLTPREAFVLERGQIENNLGLPGLVSLSDHDDIEAGLQVTHLGGFPSVEWTIPMDPVFFHIGLHNVPADCMPMLREATADPRPERLREVFATLDARPETLIVVNHPLWDEIRAGNGIHEERLNTLLGLYRPWIHALELNGLRPWAENQRVRDLADSLGLPAISGGDRHGLEPNANVNLTDAETFEEFVGEVRTKRLSHVLFMPQYKKSTRSRMLKVMCDVMRDLPGSRWCDRVFYHGRPLTQVMDNAEPGVIGQFVAFIRVAEVFL
jgi:hypothetical protein